MALVFLLCQQIPCFGKLERFLLLVTATVASYRLAGLLSKSSGLARTLGVTKFIIVGDMTLVTLCCAT